MCYLVFLHIIFTKSNLSISNFCVFYIELWTPPRSIHSPRELWSEQNLMYHLLIKGTQARIDMSLSYLHNCLFIQGIRLDVKKRFSTIGRPFLNLGQCYPVVLEKIKCTDHNDNTDGISTDNGQVSIRKVWKAHSFYIAGI